MSNASSNILVTAFMPFGPIRGNVPGLRGNRSKDLLESLKAADPAGIGLTFEVLPVDARALDRLEDRLSEGPAGVLMMGEDLLAGLRLETRARDPRSQIGPIPLPGAQWKSSPFAEGIAEAMRARGVSTDSGIGTYYCNRAYWLTLEWAERSGGRPAAFFHVGPFASIAWQRTNVEEALVRMRRAASTA